MRQYWARPRAARNNMGRIMFIMNMNGTETRQEYVQVSAGECVWIPITVLLSHINTVFEVKPTVWSHLNYYNCRK